MNEQPCWNWQKGICKFGDTCKRQHQAAPAAKQEPKSKAKPKPAAPAYFCQAGYEDIWGQSRSDDEDESTVHLTSSKRSDLAVTFNDEVDVTMFTCTPGNEMNTYPFASKQMKKDVNMVDSRLITSINALKVSEIAERVARAKR